MSATLDKSLDEIISSTRKAKKAVTKKKTVGKGIGKAKKLPIVSFKKDKPAATKASAKAGAAAPVVDFSYATKVVVHGLPRDLRQENVKVCFSLQEDLKNPIWDHGHGWGVHGTGKANETTWRIGACTSILI